MAGNLHVESKYAPTETSPLLDDDAGRAVARYEHNKREAGLGFAGFWASVFVLTKSVIGCGILTMPAVVAAAGWLVGLILILVGGILSCFTCQLMHRVAVRLGTAPTTFSSVCRKVLPEHIWLVNCMIFAHSLATMAGALMVFGAALPDATATLGWPDLARRSAVLLGFAMAGPWCLFRHLDGLKGIAAIALGVVCWTALLTLIYFSQTSATFQPCKPGAGHTAALESSPQQGLPLCGAQFNMGLTSWQHFAKYGPSILFAYTCQLNFFTVCSEIQDASEARADMVNAVTHVFSCAMYCIVGIVAYATYGERVESNVLLSYPQDTPMVATRLLYCIVVLVTYPVLMNPCRVALIDMCDCIAEKLQDASLPLPGAEFVESSGKETQRASDLKFYGLTVFLFVVTLSTALLIEDMAALIALVGSVTATSIMFIIPTLMYIKVFEEAHLKRSIAVGVCCLGFVLVPVSFVCALIFQ